MLKQVPDVCKFLIFSWMFIFMQTRIMLFVYMLETSAQSESDPLCCSILNVLLGSDCSGFQSIILTKFLLYVSLLSTLFCFQ